MDPWSNIEISPDDKEINQINKFEASMGDIPPSIRKIRELVTRFEVCHFKYQQHLNYVSESIHNLDPSIDPDTIGLNHISKGEYAWLNDKTGRSLSGQQYLWSLNNWLAGRDQKKTSSDHDRSLDLKVSEWLRYKSNDKERVVRLLIARLTYDWESFERLQGDGQYKELENQACMMDICHYAFPNHLNALIQAIGRMQPLKNFEGCGSYNSDIKKFISGKFTETVSEISEIIKSKKPELLNHSNWLRIWLYLCLAKTIKEQSGLTDTLPEISRDS